MPVLQFQIATNKTVGGDRFLSICDLDINDVPLLLKNDWVDLHEISAGRTGIGSSCARCNLVALLLPVAKRRSKNFKTPFDHLRKAAQNRQNSISSDSFDRRHLKLKYNGLQCILLGLSSHFFEFRSTFWKMTSQSLEIVNFYFSTISHAIDLILELKYLQGLFLLSEPERALFLWWIKSQCSSLLIHHSGPQCRSFSVCVCVCLSQL